MEPWSPGASAALTGDPAVPTQAGKVPRSQRPAHACMYTHKHALHSPFCRSTEEPACSCQHVLQVQGGHISTSSLGSLSGRGLATGAGSEPGPQAAHPVTSPGGEAWGFAMPEAFSGHWAPQASLPTHKAGEVWPQLLQAEGLNAPTRPSLPISHS